MVPDRPRDVGTLQAGFRSAHVRLVGDANPAKRANPRGAARPVAAGTLVALPILMTPDGVPFDLLEVTDGKAVVLLFVPPAATTAVRDYAVVATSLADRVEAAAGQLFIISRRAEAVSDVGPLLIDRDGGFAYSLGLAGWDEERGCADLESPVGLVIDDVGTVIVVDLDGPPDLVRLVDSLPNCSVATSGRAGAWSERDRG